MEKLTKMFVQMRSKLQDQKGATMVEYGLMLALIAAVCVTVVGSIGTQAESTFQTIVDALTPAV
ncbi:Flp pilus major pilin [Citrifermentans bemidjiense Bem]|uniref:Flp pilus major pilin n=1 Tax=Citrifermentans bemidjiense (strain ATCC BAA-1014 / DSM 16622 / JCM 12645 / Bem) TaxID=404380 RepID=B5EAZ3_CITBB|nr:Flp family type IVb pilin [Citrifermentans bemidjiense]ACH38854.1 Flp pilus major pilin [Citrifermentans bemidjiense Bem]